MSEVVFVREVVGDRDLVLAFARDGRPLWALDLERDLQWWYPGGSTPEVRAAIAEARPGFELLPVLAHSPDPGRHAAVELGRRAEAASLDSPPVDAGEGWPFAALRRRWTSLSRPTRRAAAGAVAVVALVAGASWLGGPSPEPPPLPVGSDGRTVTVPQAAGASCVVRGELAHDTAGRLLVCVSDGGVSPWVLAWRPAG